jgi:flagellar biosynthetic protein FliR
MFIVGLQMASPVLILTLLINSFIAILAKVAPSMNMFFSVGFIATMAVGLWLFMYLLPNILTAEQRVLQDVIHNLPKLFELVGQ